MLAIVDLPLPDPPTNATDCPFLILNDMLIKIGISVLVGYEKETFSKRTSPSIIFGFKPPIIRDYILVNSDLDSRREKIREDAPTPLFNSAYQVVKDL
jgi:hypothetical protein